MEPDTIDWQAVAKQLQAENETWRSQWKGHEYHKDNHWTVHVRKPQVVLALFTRLITFLKTVEPYKLYIYTLIVCTIVGTLAEIIALCLRKETAVNE